MLPQTESLNPAISEPAKVVEDVRRIAAEISGMPPTSIRDDQTLTGDLAWDSLDVVECAMEIEETFDVSVPEDLTDSVRTVHDLIEGVCRLVADQRGE